MHSADYAVDCVERYLSVRLSVTCRYCMEMAEHIIKHFSLPGTATILVFPCQTLWQYSDGDPPNGGV